MTDVEKLAAVFKESNNIVFFGGAGVSTESGIPDFRSAHGLWNEKLSCELSPEQLVSHSYFEEFPLEFFDFYRAKLVYPEAKPNACHRALARLEAMGKVKAVVTQNIDGLHQAAGSKVVYELHGSVLRNHCLGCGAKYGVDIVLSSKGVPKCPKCGGVVRPDVVLYEEALDNDVINDAVDALELADTLIIGGTSLVVYPAAGLVRYFRGRHLVLVNKTETREDRRAELVIHAPIGEVFEQAMELLNP